MPRWIALCLLALLPLAAAPARIARAADAGFVFYEEKARKILRSAGGKVWEAADDARKRGLYQFAAEQAERAIGFDPECTEAREYLGFLKKRDGWTLDEEAAARVPRQNQKPSNERGSMSDEDFQKIIEKWREEVLRKADEYVADKYAQLGELCAQKGYEEQARKGFEAALRLDPGNSKARKGLGYKKLGRVWLTDKQDQARKDAAKAEPIKDETEWDDLFGVTLNKVVSAHFRFESPYPVEELKEYAFHAETAYAYYLSDFGLDPTQDVFDGARLTFVVMQTDDQWVRFVDRYPGQDKQLTLQLSGTGGGMIRGVRTKENAAVNARRDQIVHQATHVLNDLVWQCGSRAWLDEGLAYYYTLKVLESNSTFCVALRQGDYARPGLEGGMKEWGDPTNWKPKMKEMVQKKSDLELRAIVNKPIATLEFDASVKSWSVVSYLMDLDRDRFMRMLADLKGARDQVGVVQSVWEKGIEELDEEWRTFVRRAY